MTWRAVSGAGVRYPWWVTDDRGGYLQTRSGGVRRFATMANAQRAADAANRRDPVQGTQWPIAGDRVVTGLGSTGTVVDVYDDEHGRRCARVRVEGWRPDAPYVTGWYVWALRPAVEVSTL